MIKRLFSKTFAISHALVKHVVEPGDYVVDATMGNGHDTVFLAKLVGSNGLVYSFDIQSIAIEKTKKLLLRNELQDRVKLNLMGHENMDQKISHEISVIMFNLGYLPKGDNNIITKPETTIIALEKSLRILKFGGIISIVLYSGHLGGAEESKQVESWVKNLDANKYDVIKVNYLNKSNNPPHFIAIQKIK